MKSQSVNGYTPTEQRILTVLSDGQAHPRKELLACLNDDMAVAHTLRHHIRNIRRKLPEGQTIVFEVGFQFKPYYRHIRLLCSNP